MADTSILPVIVKLEELSRHDRIGPTLRSQVEEAVGELEKVQGSLKESNDLNKLRQAVYRAEDAIDTFLKEIGEELCEEKSFDKVFPDCIHWRSARTRFSSELQKLASFVEKTGTLKISAGFPKKLSTVLENDAKSVEKVDTIFHDLKDEVKELAEQLLSDNSSPFLISVVDAADSVLTSELQKIYNCEDIKNYFQCRAWAPVPQELKKRQLLMDILKQVIGPEVEEKLFFIKSPQQELRNFLKQKRYLIVLINVQRFDIFRDLIEILFPNTSNGSRVILSFRKAHAAISGSAVSKNVVSDDVDTMKEQVSVPVPVPVITADIVNEEGEIGGMKAENMEEEGEIVGLKRQISKLTDLVSSGGLKYFLLSVVGVAGSGKTTLVKTIYNSSHIRRNFDLRAWVNVSDSPYFDSRNILINLLKQLTQKEVEEELRREDLERKLARRLDGKRYLIVLDDVNYPGFWNDLRWILSPTSSADGSRVIIITQKADVARSFSWSVVLHELLPLNGEESRKLFLKNVKKEETSPDLLEKIGEICGGLPLAICVLGGLLSTLDNDSKGMVVDKIMSRRKKREMEQAVSVAHQLISPNQIVSLDISYIWGLSYDHLPRDQKACFRYLYLFPKSYDIPVRRLLQLWLAERFVKITEGENRQPEDRVKENFEQLERRNMIEVVKRRSDGTPKTCRVPSSLYDTFSSNAENMGYFQVHRFRKSEFASNSQEVCVRRLAEHLEGQDKAPSDRHFECLHSYIAFDNRKGDKPANEVGDLLKNTVSKRGYRLLRVLDLEGVYKPVLPEILGKLSLLRYLGLRWTFLDSLPESIGELPCLETLDVKHTNISTLPMSIWNSKTLRHLYMNQIHLSIQKPFAGTSLTNLQTLWGLLISNKSPPMHWLDRLKNLRKLGLTCHTASLRQITEWIGGLTSLECLRLRSINDFSEPSYLKFISLDKNKKLKEVYLVGKLPAEAINIRTLPPELSILTLSLSHLPTDPMPELGKLQHLKILRLLAHSYMGEEMSSGGFPKLRVLKLWRLKALKKFTVQYKAMPKLRELEIRSCQKLRKPNGLEKVTTLKELTLTNMKKAFEDEIRESMPKWVNVVINHPPPDEDSDGCEG